MAIKYQKLLRKFIFKIYRLLTFIENKEETFIFPVDNI